MLPAAEEAWDSLQDIIDPAPVEQPMAGKIKSVHMMRPSTLGPDITPRSVPGPNNAPRSIPGPIVTPRSLVGPAAASVNPTMAAGPSTPASGFHVGKRYWVVTYGERPGIYFGQYVFILEVK